MLGPVSKTNPNNSTTPAPAFESAVFIPPAARLTPLAMAALEANIPADDVRAYLSCRYSVRSARVELFDARFKTLAAQLADGSDESVEQAYRAAHIEVFGRDVKSERWTPEVVTTEA
jgi:hypothetical protein